jgi:hypothetical protein
MRVKVASVLAVCAVLLLASVARSQVQVKARVAVTSSERNENPGPEFSFKTAPAPSKTDAAVKGAFSIIDGSRDRNGADLSALNDGRLPSEADQPRANFFFAAGSEGGRLLLDLGEVRDVKQVNTYSWHPGDRGPQVYKLYASDGAAPGFNAKPAKGTDPEKTGWTLLASVNTHMGGEPGGQYAASTAGPDGAVLGKCRYLLFDIARTQDRDSFGNTFFSEIDVIDGKQYEAPQELVRRPDDPATRPAGEHVITATAAGKYEITFDFSEMPELKPWIETRLKPTCLEWYPKIVDLLPSEGYIAPQRFSITFRKDGRGVAFASGNRITCAGPWFSRNLEGEAVGAVVHEMVHVVQQYRRVRGGNPNPGWLVEGLADYIRWHLYEPANKRRRIRPDRDKYDGSYHVTAALLAHVMEHHDKDAVKKLNAAMRQGKYSDDLWKQYTGKTAEELWADYLKTLEKPSPPRDR